MWGNTIRQVLETQRSPVTVTVQNKGYNRNAKYIKLDVKVFAHQLISGAVNMCVIQTEDSLNWTQHKYVGSTTEYLYPFYHENVFRQVVPSVLGEPLTSINIPSQTEITKSFVFNSLDSVPEHSKLVILVYRADGGKLGEVLQSYSEPLMSNVNAVDNSKPAASFSLDQNYPNPFTPATTINYSVPVVAPVTIVVTDMFGRVVRTLVNAREEAGNHSLNFDATGLHSGQYFITMRSGNFSQTKTMTLIK